MNMTNSKAAATGTRMVSAYFDTRPAAEEARSQVLAAGLAHEAVKITDGYGTVTGDAAAHGSTEGRSLWTSLKSTFTPEAPARDDNGENAPRRGGFLVTAHAPEDLYSEVRRILEGSGSVERGAEGS